jgi:hypothetical protein
MRGQQMKKYEAFFVVADASGYVHNYSRGTLWAFDQANAFEQLSREYPAPENGAFWKLVEVI